MRRTAGLLAILLVAGCDSPEPPRPGPVPSSAAPSSAPAPATASASAAVPAVPAVERTVDAAGTRLTMGLPPLARTPDGAVVLTAQVRLDAGSSVLVTDYFSSVTAGPFDEVRLIDPANRRVYLVATEQDGTGCACSAPARVGEGGSVALRAAFTGVPVDVTTLSVMLPYAGVFADVPVQDGPYPGELDPAGRSAAADLDAYAERRDVPLSTRTTRDGVDLDLDTDVLFRLDSARLTPAAAKALGAAADAIAASGPGPLTITGHTDSAAGAAHNQRLSEDRARTVALALRQRLPDARWPKAVSGKGETRPLFANDSPEHRRRNRRVTITYRPAGRPPPPPPDVPPPPTEGVQGTGAQGVEVALPLGQGTIRLTAGPARVRGPFVQVDLVAANIGAGDATILRYLGQGAYTVRDELDPSAPYGASGVRAFAGDQLIYAVDYTDPGGGHRCLCDRRLDQPFPPGSTRTVALWYPATGTKTITLDVPDGFRLTGIPVVTG